MSFLVSGIFVVFIAAITYKLLKDRYKLFKLNITEPKDFPFIVEFFYPIIMLGMGSAEERFKLIADYCLRFPDMVKMWLGPKMLIFTSNPDRIQKILLSQKCLEKWNFFYGLMERDHGLISGSLKRKWKDHRKFFNFSFNLKILESFLPSFIDYSEVLCNQLAADVETQEFDFFMYAKKISFDILCATSLGTNMMDFKNNKSFYEKIFDAYET
jgi:cytochrome P450 family 4